ncbi:unnamed protein product, partial [Prorocentrum cordatum]
MDIAAGPETLALAATPLEPIFVERIGQTVVGVGAKYVSAGLSLVNDSASYDLDGLNGEEAAAILRNQQAALAEGLGLGSRADAWSADAQKSSQVLARLANDTDAKRALATLRKSAQAAAEEEGVFACFSPSLTTYIGGARPDPSHESRVKSLREHDEQSEGFAIVLAQLKDAKGVSSLARAIEQAAAAVPVISAALTAGQLTTGDVSALGAISPSVTEAVSELVDKATAAGTCAEDIAAAVD